MRFDGKAPTGYCQAQVSVAGLSQQESDNVHGVYSFCYLLSVRCKESESPHAVTVYMLEPQTCQYILGVSS